MELRLRSGGRQAFSPTPCHSSSVFNLSPSTSVFIIIIITEYIIDIIIVIISIIRQRFNTAKIHLAASTGAVVVLFWHKMQLVFSGCLLDHLFGILAKTFTSVSD